MRLLTFLARRFAWQAHERVQPDAEPAAAGEFSECVVAFVHAEHGDEAPERRASALRQCTKHVEWLARKRGTQRCVLHSFAHLGARTAEPGFARDFLAELAARLRARGFEVAATPFGWSCAWDLAVHGEGVAKVWKQLDAGGDAGA